MPTPIFYRLAVWVPILVPAIVAWVVHGLGIHIGSGVVQKVGQLLLASLLYGGVPYALLALWAMWWIGGRTEDDIRRMAMRAPLLMIAFFVPVALIAGVVVGAPTPFAAVAVAGAIVIIPLGYGYVAVVLTMRRLLPA